MQVSLIGFKYKKAFLSIVSFGALIVKNGKTKIVSPKTLDNAHQSLEFNTKKLFERKCSHAFQYTYTFYFVTCPNL